MAFELPGLETGERFSKNELLLHHWNGVVEEGEKDIELYKRRREQIPTQSLEFSDVLGSIRQEYGIELHAKGFPLISIWVHDLANFLTTAKAVLPESIDLAIFRRLVIVLIESSLDLTDSVYGAGSILKPVGYKIELLSGMLKSEFGANYSATAAVDTLTELVSFLVEIIRHLRNDRVSESSDQFWASLGPRLGVTLQSISTIFESLEKLTTQRRVQSQIDDFARLQGLISMGQRNQPTSATASVPCISLPIDNRTMHYNRDDYFGRMTEHFESNSSGVSSLLLFGMGGVGKSHVALRYAHSQSENYEALFWIRSETEATIAQDFTDIALRLRLPQSKVEHHVENRISVLTWLQTTAHKWMIVFDNVDDPSCLSKYWPITGRGNIILTSRQKSELQGLVQKRVEVHTFEVQAGMTLLLQLLSMDIGHQIAREDSESALVLSEKLSGHALAIKQIAGLIQRRSWSIREFLELYESNVQRLHSSSDSVPSLDTVWQLSFTSLESDSRSLLGVISFMAPDFIPEIIFNNESGSLPKSLEFCSDVLSFSGVLEALLKQALIKRDHRARSLSIHRLVQTQFRFHLSPSERQRAFDECAKILYAAFPKYKSAVIPQYYNEWAACRLYLPHVLSIKQIFQTGHTSLPDPLRADVEFCLLMSLCSRYLLEIGWYQELEDLLSTTLRACTTLDVESRDPLLLARILNTSGIMWHHRGNLSLSKAHLLKAHSLRKNHQPVEKMLLRNSCNNIGLLFASLNEYTNSLQWLLEAESFHLDGEDHNELNPQAQVDANIGRTLCLLGRNEDSLTRLERSLEGYMKSENWAVLSLTLYDLAVYHHTTGSLDKAASYCQKARDNSINNGQAPTHTTIGAFDYRMACILLDMGKRDDAITRLKDALSILAMRRQVLLGDYARCLFKLSRCLLSPSTSSPNLLKIRNRGEQEGGDESGDATEMLRQARAIREKLAGAGGQRMDEEDDSEEEEQQKFDHLVCSIWR